MVATGVAPESQATGLRADLAVVNARIWTGNERQPEAEALAVWRDRIVAIGSEEEVRALVGWGTRVLDAQGRRVVPGFFDSHIHLLGAGLHLSQVQLKDAADEAEFARRLQEFDRKLPRDRWLLGGNWDHDRTFGGRLPTAELLDKYVPDRPVFLRRYDGHMALANSKALHLAGITAATRDPPGGEIGRGPDGRPNGILRDNAMNLVTATGLIPPPSDEELAEAVRAALREAARCGVTSVTDMDGSEPATRRRLLALLQRMRQSGQLTLRIDFRWPLAEARQLADLGLLRNFGDQWLTLGGLKGFVDGSLGSSTAKMFEPYLHEPGNTGVFVTPPQRLREWIAAADRAGLAVCLHAIGDQANAELLDIYAELVQAHGPRDRRFRIEHAQHFRPQDFRRCAELQVIASVQPYHIVDDGRWAEGRIGRQRCASSYALRSFLDAGVRLAFGSDWPVAPLDPLLGIAAAVHRRTLDGKHPQGWFPEQKISVAEALHAYTLGSAYAAFQEHDRGSLEVGKLADFVVLSRDILDPREQEHLAQTQVLVTVVGGKVVHELDR
jgi:predicted amidohydrolase YtcJ